MQKTEMRNDHSRGLDKMSTREMIKVMNSENYNAVKAVENATEEIAAAIDVIAAKMANGGRLLYVGAGTSGRLGVLDASECPPTFGVDNNRVVGIIAGGKDALTNASEGAEDMEAAGIRDVMEAGITPMDALVGISAAGNAKYVVGALRLAKEVGAAAIGLTCNKECLLANVADILIVTDTGSEVLTGSTRLKAGTAHKLVLNMLSTFTMVKLGYVYDNYMINVRPVNVKLRQRCIRIIQQLTDCDIEMAERVLDETGGSIRKSIQRIQGEEN